MNGTWTVNDIEPDSILRTKFELNEAFANQHDEGRTTRVSFVIDAPTFALEAYTMDHRTPTLAYVVREKAKSNIDTSRLAKMGLRPGPWMK